MTPLNQDGFGWNQDGVPDIEMRSDTSRMGLDKISMTIPIQNHL